jgi:hypothetical protein
MSSPTLHGSLNVAWGSPHHLFTVKKARVGKMPPPPSIHSSYEFTILED